MPSARGLNALFAQHRILLLLMCVATPIIVALTLFPSSYEFIISATSSITLKLKKNESVIGKEDSASSCCTFQSWESWGFCPASDKEVVKMPVYRADADEDRAKNPLAWSDECLDRKSWSFAEPAFDDPASCSTEPLFDYFVRNKRAHPSLRGSRILLLGDSTFRMMFHDACSLFLPERHRRAANSPHVAGRAWDFNTPTPWGNWTNDEVVFHDALGATKARVCSVPRDDFSLAWSMIFSADDTPGNPGLASWQAGGLKKTNTTWRIDRIHADLSGFPSWGNEAPPTMVVFGSCFWDLTLVNETATDEQVEAYGAAVQERGAQLRRLFPKARILFQTCFLGHKFQFPGMSYSNEHRYVTMARRVATSESSEWDGLVDPWTLLQNHRHLSFDGTHYPPSVSLAVFNLALNHIDICEQNQTEQLSLSDLGG